MQSSREAINHLAFSKHQGIKIPLRAEQGEAMFITAKARAWRQGNLQRQPAGVQSVLHLTTSQGSPKCADEKNKLARSTLVESLKAVLEWQLSGCLLLWWSGLLSSTTLAPFQDGRVFRTAG